MTLGEKIGLFNSETIARDAMMNTNSPKMIDARYRFITTLGKEAQSCGVSSVRLQSYLTRVSESFGLKAGFMITPSAIHYVFQRSDQSQVSFFQYSEAATFDMNKLMRISSLVDRATSGDLDLEEAVNALENVGQTSPVYGRWLVGLGYILSGMGFAVLLSASWTDVMIAALLSAVVYGMVLMSGRLTWLARPLEFAAALVAGMLAYILAWLSPGSDVFTTTLCGVIVLVPGWGLTIGLAEITGNMIASGMQRLIGAILTSVKLFIGAMIGTWIVSGFLAIAPPLEVADQAGFWPWIAVAGLMIGLAMVFQVRRDDVIWALAGGLLAYAGIVIGAPFGYWQGSFIGAMALGAFAYLYSWRYRRPTSIVLVTGIMILVPGAASLIGLAAGQSGGAADVIGAEWRVFVIAMAIIAGLIVPYTTLPRHATL